ncbi:MAG TPA: carboxymuconolactone decarboxylase family protein [Rhizomicrobium sp.]|nr:carboxymuconolactone decarboxylase family protein [Rhizomicrobium sp.]
MNEVQTALVAPYAVDGRVDNVFRTVVRYPELMKRWLPFVNHVLLKSALSLRQREILILRTGWLCRSEYEWAQHVRGGKRAGLSDADIACIMAGDGLSGDEDLLLCAADELHRDNRIGASTWAALSQMFSEQQLMDIVFAVGQYTMVSMVLNTLGIEVDENLRGYPPLPAKAG